MTFEQHSPEWFAARLGIPTASGFKSIISSTGKPSTSADTYLYKLLAEWVMGVPTQVEQTEWMARGNLLEGQARAFYEIETGRPVTEVGFIRHDEWDVGCSPDGLTDRGGLELKVPAPHTHIKYLLSGRCPAEYVPQVQGCMWLTNAKEWDFMSFHPDMEPLLVTVKRDNDFIKALETEVEKFLKKMHSKRQQLIEMGVKK